MTDVIQAIVVTTLLHQEVETMTVERQGNEVEATMIDLVHNETLQLTLRKRDNLDMIQERDIVAEVLPVVDIPVVVHLV